MVRVSVADGNLLVDPALASLIEEIAPISGIAPGKFWADLHGIVQKFGPRNKELLAKRDEIQEQLDTYHMQRVDAGNGIDPEEYAEFLGEIGYLVPPVTEQVVTSKVDPEIASIAGPQLVCPVDNARFALNAANARWGSLLDALYGTDAVPGDRDGPYNDERGRLVFDAAEIFLDETWPLERPRFAVTKARYNDVRKFDIAEKGGTVRLVCTLADGTELGLAQPEHFVGYKTNDDSSLSSVLLVHNDLHCEIQIDPNDRIGSTHPASVKVPPPPPPPRCGWPFRDLTSAAIPYQDIILESAVTTIMDCEDSVAAVDALDKVEVYSNWAGLMRGDLVDTFEKDGAMLDRALNPDLTFTSAHGNGAATVTLPGRSLLLVRNVGIHMYTNAVTTVDGEPIPEGLLDAMVTVMSVIPDIQQKNALSNSRTGSCYIVKPKMHGPEEVAFVVEIFDDVEAALGLDHATVKLGIMDEERRTTVNLGACIAAARERVAFINTGFLDRTGDEIHTSMEAGPFLPKAEIRLEPWIGAYEDQNVDVGLASGLGGKAQIGKGMWAAPDDMANMLEEKIGHPTAGANTAWVPSPTAATLHAMHYHQVSVKNRQKEILEGGARGDVATICVPPLMQPGRELSAEEVERELDNNSQGILGYVVRWIDQGVGCSKVPDISNVALMEDRATLRISSQHMANWLHHGVATEEQVMNSLKKMALVVDEQNSDDDVYVPMAPAYSGTAWEAAVELVLNGRNAPNGENQSPPPGRPRKN
eukprot:COSAG04_NODE_828_length_10025_cov_3.607092_8_plen_758_part_00